VRRVFSNTEAMSHSGETVRFSFGHNWRKYLRRLTPDRIQLAEKALEQSFGGIGSITGSRFIDVGCGSGVFSLAALGLGASQVTSIDADPQSISCAEVLRTTVADPSRWEIKQASILDEHWLASVRPATRVYCWGVLHHTGDLWGGLKNTLALLDSGGLLCLALYSPPRHPDLHLRLKRLYNRLPRSGRLLMAVGYSGVLLSGVLVARRRNPIGYVRHYGESARAMSFWRDVEDWLGGLPCAFTTVEEVTSFVRRQGFERERTIRRAPGANNEYLVRRPT
jgi:SAM-dependent methyltransferase